MGRLSYVFFIIVCLQPLFSRCEDLKEDYDRDSHTNRVLLDDNKFLWGVATAAYQIEGAVNEDGKGPTIWDAFAKIPGKIKNGDTADIADDHYHKFEEDVRLAKNMGVNSYRFSISWARILPHGYGEVNQQGIAFYTKLINLLVAFGIEPFVTLYHWDLPQALQDEYGGWLSPTIETHFANFAEICFQNFGDRVKFWATINEPWSFSVMAYEKGIFAPGRCSDRSRCAEGDSNTEPFIVAHNVLNAHAAAVEIYRNRYQSSQKGHIGMVLNLDWPEPYTSSPEDQAAAQIRREFSLAWFADPIYFGHYPLSMYNAVGENLPKFTPEQIKRIAGSIDFFAINHYTTKYFKHHPNDGKTWSDLQQNEETKYASNGNIIGPQGESPWLNTVPWGIYKMLMWISNRYTVNGQKPFIIITENGYAIMNESKLPLPQVLHDVDRISYYYQYFQEIKHAVRDGVQIQGYFAWSLLDNFEWADGYTCRFGMHYVDYSDPNRPRYPKDSAKWYGAYALTHPFGFYEQNPNKRPWTSTMVFYWGNFFKSLFHAIKNSRFFPKITTN
jgi:beta-galactosidase